MQKDDVIYRRAALDAIYESANDLQDVLIPAYYRDLIKALPSVQHEPSIPLSWIEEYIERLRNTHGIYSALRVDIINAMIDEWRKGEQDEND